MVHFSAAIKAFSGFMWGYPLLILLIGGGLFFSYLFGVYPSASF